jgi:tRNA 2-thiouridine synthesizing protein B
MLHIVNKSPFDRTSLEACLRVARQGSTILLIEDGVYGALDGTEKTELLKQALKQNAVCVLEPDLKARGVQNKVLEGVKRVDYAGFVDLVTESERVQSWM